MHKLEQLQVAGEPVQLTFGITRPRSTGRATAAASSTTGATSSQVCGESASPAGRPSSCSPYQGSEALSGALRYRHGLSDCAGRTEHLGTPHAVLPESPAIRRCDLSRDRVDVL